MFFILRKIKCNLLKLNWSVLFWFMVLHSSVSWFFMYLGDEYVSKTVTDWVYFYIVTATTVGYGDFSPESNLAKWAASIWIIPGSIGLFAALIGKATADIADAWRKNMKGTGSFEGKAGHTVILGWHGSLTEKMVDILYKDPSIKGDIVLCVVKDIENPMPDKIDFIRGDSFSNPDLLKRAGIEGAKRILIYAESDEQAVAISVSVSSLRVKGHIVTYCEKIETVNMLSRIIPNIECIQNYAIETLVRSAQDPGVSRVVQELLSLDHGANQYCGQIPERLSPSPFGFLMTKLYQKHNAILIGYIDDKGQVKMSPDANEQIDSCMSIIYIANNRIDSDDFI